VPFYLDLLTRLKLMNKFVPQFLLASLFVFASVTFAGAQVKSKSAKVTPAKAEQADPVSDLQKFRQEFIKAAEKQETLKSLYTDGLISRKEYEASGTDIADARAKVEEMRAEVVKADETLAAARKPIETFTLAPAPSVRTDVAWSTGNKSIDNLIRLNGQRYGVDPYLIYCVIRQESGFRSTATSPVGAMGLMQLMPGTAARYGVTNPYDPAQSIMGGTRYLANLLRLFGGRVDLALAGYNAGEGAVMKYGRRVPPYAETQNYVRTIGARYAQSGGNGVTLTTKTEAREAQGNRK